MQKDAHVFLLLVVGVVSVLAADEEQMWGQHASRVRRALCMKPRERVVTLEELGVSTPSGHSLSPAASTLHRCDDNPVCCGGGVAGHWVAIGSQPVQLVFAVSNMVNTSEARTYITVPAENHTKCGCR